jgi:DNA repair protein RadD
MIFTEGFDELSASCLILARPTKLLTMYRQMAGRVLRPIPARSTPASSITAAPTSDEKAVNKSAEAHTVVHKRARDLPKVQAVRMEGQGCNAGGSKPETKPRHLEVVDGWVGPG